MEAWRVSWENLGRSNKKAIDDLQEEAKIQQTLRLIQKIPLARFSDDPKENHRDTMHGLLLGYREQLIEIIELLVKSRRSVPPSLRKAIKHIETILGIKHWVGVAGSSSPSDADEDYSGPIPKSSPPPSTTGVPPGPDFSYEEQILYDHLVLISGLDEEDVERLIEFERQNAPHAIRADLIQRAIDRWVRDH